MSMARDCICKICDPGYPFMAVCELCGNKRCPHITYHEHDCTRSNATGQTGSAYGDTLCGKPDCACIELNAQYERDRLELRAAFPSLFTEK